MSNTLTASPSTCPICGDTNLCAMADQPNASDCWCREVNIPQQLIDQANSQNKDRYCICQNCAQRANALAQEI
ncbi:cysteine-rich CWC family protein [Oceanicoccus sagamiensis]|uniref:Cysteine-rich CWC family protein n=1 Tax=Oceanicoccus sagamiensis TaxID=716816 RepID=A0A1X9N9B8_9GAMM|nr:cysteine-rich CWC family protein [Oceanicoccus sagamiensis]ARN74678.1 hypothetical protein BST96_11440 [Oceanicoccus sagamiensis]